MISVEIQTAAYLFASILFILSLSGLSNQESAKRGVIFGIIGMVIAIIATLLGNIHGYAYIIIAMLIASVIGILVARKVQMTAMPQLIAMLHSFVGLAAVLVGYGSYIDPKTLNLLGAERTIHYVEIYLGVFIGAITFTGSLIAWGKLTGKVTPKPVVYKGKDIINILLLVVSVVLGVFFVQATGIEGMPYLAIMTAIAAFFGIMLVMAIGGADMPVVISMLNSLSGWAAAASGFTLGNDLLIITGALVGSSGAILSIIMCKAMNRSFFAVISGGFGLEVKTGAKINGKVTSITHDEAAEWLKEAQSIVIVPGYGMAVAKAQYPIHDLVEKT